MKYYSEVTKQLYGTPEELTAAEDKAAQAQAAEEEKKKARQARAKEVEDAYKAAVEAHNHYIELKNKFLDDYKQFHYTFTEKTPVKNVSDLFDTIDFLFGL